MEVGPTPLSPKVWTKPPKSPLLTLDLGEGRNGASLNTSTHWVRHRWHGLGKPQCHGWHTLLAYASSSWAGAWLYVIKTCPISARVRESWRREHGCREAGSHLNLPQWGLAKETSSFSSTLRLSFLMIRVWRMGDKGLLSDRQDVRRSSPPCWREEDSKIMSQLQQEGNIPRDPLDKGVLWDFLIFTIKGTYRAWGYSGLSCNQVIRPC